MSALPEQEPSTFNTDFGSVAAQLSKDAVFPEPANSASGYKKHFYQNYYAAKIHEIKGFFSEYNYDVALAAFELLSEKKAGLIRRNGYTPDHGHEIDQILPLLKSLNAGMLDIEAIEKEHGDIQKWFCSILTHDIGEDFNMFPEDLARELEQRIIARKRNVSDHDKDMIQHTVKSMEVLTHYRKFSVPEFSELTEAGLDVETLEELAHLENGDVIDLSEFKEMLWNKMNVLAEMDAGNLQVFARRDEGKAPVIIVTRYGKSRETVPRDETHYGAEWNSYILTVLQYGIYEAITKMGDRAQGMATRIALLRDYDKVRTDIENYESYLAETKFLFDTMGSANLITQHLYPDTPLKQTINSISQMMGVLEMVGSLYLVHHPYKNKDGQRGFSSLNLSALPPWIRVSPIHTTRFPEANHFYKYVDRDSHLLVTIMRELRDARDPSPEKSLATLYDQIRTALCELGPEVENLLVKRSSPANVPLQNPDTGNPPLDEPGVV